MLFKKEEPRRGGGITSPLFLIHQILYTIVKFTVQEKTDPLHCPKSLRFLHQQIGSKKKALSRHSNKSQALLNHWMT